jgi:hypothetical protein
VGGKTGTRRENMTWNGRDMRFRGSLGSSSPLAQLSTFRPRNLQIYKLLTSTLVSKLYAGDCVDVGTAVPEFSDQWQVTPGFTALQTSSLMVLKAKKIPTSTKERASGIRKDGARSSLDGTITLAPTARSFRRA